MSIDFSWPIEWECGSPACLSASSWEDLQKHGALTAYNVLGSQEPRGWTRQMPKIHGPFLVTPNGTLDGNYGPLAPRLRNIDMPALRFKDDTAPVGGYTNRDGTAVFLMHQDGKTYGYGWPTLRQARDHDMPIREITVAQIQAEKKAAEEAMAMEENPLFGMF